MALIQKLNPQGIDIPIDEFQGYLFGSLGFADYESYPRVYLNPNERGRLAEYYDGNKEYKEVLYSDKHEITSYFLVDETRDLIEDGEIVETTVSLIVQANVLNLFPLVAHRADEELNNLIHSYSVAYYNNRVFRLTSIENGVENVYREIDTSRLKTEDMSEQYIVRFNYRVRYYPTCEIIT
jgi:hypothetical protein